jgi:low affinity Fe/Cu permease
MKTMKTNKTKEHHWSEKIASNVTRATGSTAAIIIAFATVCIWAVCGPIFHFSENWQLVINTGTTIITFLMVFLIQKAQNKDSLAIQIKLNELLAAHEFASNRIVDVEDIPEEDLRVIKKYYQNLSEITKNEENLQKSHSIEEAHELHKLKKGREEEIKKTIRQNKPSKPKS